MGRAKETALKVWVAQVEFKLTFGAAMSSLPHPLAGLLIRHDARCG